MEINDESNIDRLIEERFAGLRADAEWRPNLPGGLERLRERKAASSVRGRRRAVTGGVVAAVCLPLIAFPATRAFAAHCVSACVAETGVVRGFLLGSVAAAPASSTYIRPEDRRMAPDFTLDDASGKAITLSGMRGKVVLLNFWATWCTPCAGEIPWFVEFQQSRQERGFAVLGVSMDADGWAAVKPFIETKRVNYSVVTGGEKVAALFGGLKAIPLTLVVDRTGRVAAIHAGLCTKEEFETDIDAVLNER